MCELYAGLGKTRFTVVRHSNIYGPHDKFDLERSHVFGATITKVMTAADGRLVVWGRGDEARDLLHVTDLNDFVERALERQPDQFGLYHCGLGRAIPVRELVAAIVDRSGRGLAIEHDLEQTQHRHRGLPGLRQGRPRAGLAPTDLACRGDRPYSRLVARERPAVKAKPGYRLLARRPLAANERFHLFFDDLQLPSGRRVPKFLIVKPKVLAVGMVSGVCVLPEVAGRIGLMRSYRHQLRRSVWQAVAGFVEPGESIRATAAREVTEETTLACRPRDLVSLGRFFPEPGLIEAALALFVVPCAPARGLPAPEEVGTGKLTFFAPRGPAPPAGPLQRHRRQHHGRLLPLPGPPGPRIASGRRSSSNPRSAHDRRAPRFALASIVSSSSGARAAGLPEFPRAEGDSSQERGKIGKDGWGGSCRRQSRGSALPDREAWRPVNRRSPGHQRSSPCLPPFLCPIRLRPRKFPQPS